MKRIRRIKQIKRGGRLYLSLLGTLLPLLGCGSDTTGPAPVDPAVLPWRVTLNVQAVTLSTAPGYDTLQLVPIVQTVHGTPVSGAVRLTYTSLDPSSVLVDSMGLVHAVGPTAQTPIRVTASVGDASVFITLPVRVTEDAPAPPRLDHITLEGTQSAAIGVPIPAGFQGLVADCGSSDLNFPVRMVQLQVGLFTSTEELDPGTLLVAYTSSDPDILAVSADGELAVNCGDGRTGLVTITASTTAYGVTKSASLHITVVPKLLALVVAQPTVRTTGAVAEDFDPGTLTIGAGGIVVWRSFPLAVIPFLHVDSTFVMPSQRPIDVVFDAPPGPVQGVDTTALDTTALGPSLAARLYFPYPYDPAGGDIPAFKTDTAAFAFPGYVHLTGARARQFPVPGTYHYHSTLYGTTGTIIVRPWTP